MDKRPSVPYRVIGILNGQFKYSALNARDDVEARNRFEDEFFPGAKATTAELID